MALDLEELKLQLKEKLIQNTLTWATLTESMRRDILNKCGIHP